MTKEEEDQRTKEIIHRLEALSIETSELLTELRVREVNQHALQPPQPPKTIGARARPHQFRVGDRAIIANNYLRQRNIQGSVIYTTPQRITLIDEQGNRYTRKPTNLRKI
jgi:hypothetical protein